MIARLLNRLAAWAFGSMRCELTQEQIDQAIADGDR